MPSKKISTPLLILLYRVLNGFKPSSFKLIMAYRRGNYYISYTHIYILRNLLGWVLDLPARTPQKSPWGGGAPPVLWNLHALTQPKRFLIYIYIHIHQ